MTTVKKITPISGENTKKPVAFLYIFSPRHPDRQRLVVRNKCSGRLFAVGYNNTWKNEEDLREQHKDAVPIYEGEKIELQF